MKEDNGMRRSSAAFFIKILVVLLFPVDGNFSFPYFRWTSVLLQVGGDTPVSLTPIHPGLYIMLPCLIFEWRLNSSPISKSIKRDAATACFLSWLISLLLPSFYQIMYGTDIYYFQTLFTPILSISFFVILPLISRETTTRSISTEHRDLSYRFITSTLRKRFRGQKVLSVLLWLGLVFCPFLFFLTNYGWFYQIQLFSLFYSEGGILENGALLFAEFNVDANNGLILPIFAFFSAIRFVFVRDVFRYQIGTVSKSRLVSVALLGELLPSAALTLIALITIPPGDGFFPLFYPLPFLPILGFAFLIFSKFVPIKEELWQGYEHRMWFEKKQDPCVPEQLDETIKVPITYLLVSQVRKRMNNRE